MEYVKSLLKPISSEIGLRGFERDVVENAVEKLIDAVSTMSSSNAISASESQ